MILLVRLRVLSRIILILWILLLAIACAPLVVEKGQSGHEAESADITLFVNASVITVDDRLPKADALAIRDDRILAVGSRSQVEASIAGSAGRVLVRDLQHKTVLPGFIDAHGHFTYSNRLQLFANVASPPVWRAQTIADIVDLLRQHEAEHPQAEWIVGFGYDDSLLAEHRHPTKADLDRVSVDKPVAIIHVSSHLISCNSRCLEAAEIDASTPDPQGGVIRRIAGSNEPDGVLEEAAMFALMMAMPQPGIGDQLALLDNTQKDYASYGVTTVQDGASNGEGIAMLQRAAEQQRLYLDVVAYPHTSMSMQGLQRVEYGKDYENGFRLGGIKIVLDGSPQGKTAWLSKHYHVPPVGRGADYAGYSILSDDAVQHYVSFAYENNIPLLAHANGDRAAAQMIEAIEQANHKYGKADRRPVMIHAQTVRADQLAPMRAAGIVPSYFIAHTFYWGDWHRDSVLGPERAAFISPLRSSSNTGLRYTIHNDTPVVPSDMMRLLWTAVNRVTRSGKVLGENERVTPMEGIKAMTLDAAYQFFEEGSKGSIEVGKRADLVVLDRNPLDVPPMEIKDIKVLETIKDGKTVFKR